MEIHAINTWVNQRDGVVVVEDDVQNVVRDIKALSPRLHVFYNPQTAGFDIVESCIDGTDRLVFSADTLDQRVLHRLRGADHWYGEDTPTHILPDEEDFITKLDADNARIEEENKEQARDKIRDAGERLAWALDIVNDRPSVGGSIRVPKDVNG